MIYFRGLDKKKTSCWRQLPGAWLGAVSLLALPWFSLGAQSIPPSASRPKPAPPLLSEVDALMNKAQMAQFRGDMNSALSLASKAIELEATNAQCFYVRGRVYTAMKEPAKAVGDFSRALELEPRGAEIYQLRGIERFKLGQFDESIADFNRFLKFVPKQEAYHWHRGIAYYFAGRFADAQKQFEMRQAAGTNTAENALWHFLSVARASGLEKARASMFPAPDESMLVMRKLQDCYLGKVKPEELMASAQANYSSSAQLQLQMFFANLYLGLYYEASGDEKKALVHMTEASGQYKLENFMGEVAAIKTRLLTQKVVRQ